MIRIRQLTPVLALLIGACAAPATQSGSAPARTATAVATESGIGAITASSIHSHIAYLASDELRGRDTPSPGLEAAAEFLANELRSYGVEPAGDNGTFLQRWPYTTARMSAEVTRLRASGAEPDAYRYGRDFFAFASGVESASGEAVFVGTLDALANVPEEAVSGKIAIALLPGMPTAAILGAGATAAARGAAGLVIVMDPAVVPQAIPQLTQAMEAGAGAGQPVPTFGILYRSASQLFTRANLELDAFLRNPPSSPVALQGTTLELVTGADVREHHPPNVVGVVRGSDPALRDTYIAISAHFDHVGVGGPVNGDSIYNGADDNASGTAALLAVARAFATLPQPPARSVLFVAVSGEEKGLLGSQYFVENPTVPIDRIVANINLDMVGRNHPDSLVIIGEDFSTLGPLSRRVAAAHPDLRLTLAPDPDPSEMVFFRSDHFSFARKGIPAIFFTTWLHADYHQPSDRVEKIDQDKVARIARFVYHLTQAISADRGPPEWTPEGRATMSAIGQ